MDIRETIQKTISEHPVVLYMKGTPEEPLCGYSAQALAILKEYGVPFHAVDVLQDPEVRRGIKEFSDWPTIPQLYIQGVFIGGCDLMAEMHQGGELAERLAAALPKEG